MFFWNSCFFYDPVDVGNLISGSSALSKTSLNIRKFTVHIWLKPGFKNFEHYFTIVWDECNCVAVWAFSGIAFLWAVVMLSHLSDLIWKELSHLSFLSGSGSCSQDHALKSSWRVRCRRKELIMRLIIPFILRTYCVALRKSSLLDTGFYNCRMSFRPW